MKLSLIIPCYNESKNLELLVPKCKKLTDSRDDIEVILVNNGSTDDSEQVMTELLTNEERIRSVKVEVNQGYGFGILSGMKEGKGEILAWTHADMQTDPMDALKGLEFFEQTKDKEKIFVKGKRFGRPFMDVFFTIGMAFFEMILMQKIMWDINAQPTMMHRNFFHSWQDAPHDFSLDLFAYYMAKNNKLEVKRFPVLFGERAHGTSHWNVDFKAKLKFIKRTINYSIELKKRIKS